MALPTFTPYPRPPPPPPFRVIRDQIQLKGSPTRIYFYCGGIGSIVCGFAILFVGIILILLLLGIGFFYPSGYWESLLMYSFCFLSIGCIMIGLGFYGFYRNYGTALGLATMIFSIMASLPWIALSLQLAAVLPEITYEEFEATRIVFVYLLCSGTIGWGIMLILQGVTVCRVSLFTAAPALTKATSIVMIFSGALFCSVTGIFFSEFYLAALSYIILTYFFGGFFLAVLSYFILTVVFFLEAFIPSTIRKPR
ncbi:MAG: hypothetical protein AB1485_01020 [Candidatus Thermoplasmatota archaeon]